jgi:hypothetical integral membrane protein (TIGR02206 family)
MFEAFYKDSHIDVTHTSEHYINVIAYLSFGFLILYLGRYKWNEEQKRKNIVIICAAIYGLQLFKTGIRMYLGVFDHKVDLPLHVCNLVPLCMALAYYFRSRRAFSIFFFWIMCGTLQASVTPTLWDYFPHYESIRYWATHTVMPIIAVYGLVVLGYKIYFKDVIISWAVMAVSAYVMYHINNLLSSNYWFANAKPNAKTMYDLLGPWPTYMFQLLPLTLTLFTLMFFITRGVRWINSNYGKPV